MFDQFLLVINSWMMGSIGFALIGSFLWGIISVLFSPCHLASIPLMIGYVAGQENIVKSKQAISFAFLFSLGLFISIAIIGLICSLLGRMLGDVSPLLAIPVGLLFIVLGLNMLGIQVCHLPNTRITAFKLKGYTGAFILGLSYGILSGACTFGFIAPILAIITIQAEVARGMSLILLFALGHCLPIVLAGSFVALTQKFLMNKGMQNLTKWGRKIAGIIVISIGLYFILTAF